MLCGRAVAHAQEFCPLLLSETERRAGILKGVSEQRESMKSTQVVIVNKLGLHARAAAKLVQLSNQFDARISLEKEGESADAKSIMEVLMLAGTQDTELTITAEGTDEEVALVEIERLIADKFEEEE